MKSISIFCGSSNGTNPQYKEAAEKTAQLLAEKQITLVYGGGGFGLMGAAADSALKHEGKVIGIIPTLLVDKEHAKKDITELYIVGSMQERKAKLMELSDGFIILPGGVGTMDELFEVMAFINLRVHYKPCGILNTTGFYDSIISYLDKATSEGFIKEYTRSYLVHDDDPAALLKKMEMVDGK